MRSTEHKALLYVVFSTPLFSSSLLGSNILLSALFSYNVSLWFLPQCERPDFAPIQNNSQIIVLFILIFIFLDRKLEDERFYTEWQQTFPEFSLLLFA